MREIGTIPDEKDARRFADYLLTLDITSRIDPKPDGCSVWVHREERVAEGRRELESFLRAPNAEQYQGIEQSARALRQQAEREERRHVKNSVDLRDRLDYRPSRRFPLTIVLIATSVAVGAASNLGSKLTPIRRLTLPTFRLVAAPQFDEKGEQISPGVIRRDGLVFVRRGEVWRLVTPIFIHFGPLHLLFNMMWMYDLGGMIEMRKGTARFGALVLVSAVASNLGQYAWSSPGTTFGGLSGVNYALLGYAWMKGHYDPDEGIGLRVSTVQFMLLWLVLCMTGVMGPIANAAHVVGLLVGMLIGFAPHAPGEIRRWL